MSNWGQHVIRVAVRGLKLVGYVLTGVLTLTALAAAWGLTRTAVQHPAPPPTVNDVTQLNPIAVTSIITPTTTDEIVAAVRTHPGPIAVGGGRYSMGGQTATDGALHIDMRRFNRILEFSPSRRTITVQAGARWRQIQEHIDSAGLSVKIMQTYANFTVGGSLSVNAHGRYVGLGPLVLSVRRIVVVLADGSLVEATATQRPDVFYGVIGGYGGLGVIVEVTLDLTDNVRVRREYRTMPVTEYREYFAKHVRHRGDALFHNADLYPDDYTTVTAVTYAKTDEPVTVPDRLIPADASYAVNQFLFWVISEWPGGKTFRQRVIDPAVYAGDRVTWRNYEASYDVAELEPGSRAQSTYVLQEYFIPVERFDDFVPRMREILRRHRVNMINASIRHSLPDPGTLLAWARGEVFSFVLYYKQGTSLRARDAVGEWTRELIEAAIDVGGTYYLPYQPLATDDQFLRAYPRAPEFFALKRRLDPGNKFRNTLWDRYYTPRIDPLAAPLAPKQRARLAAMPGYRRDGGQTFLTHPEWYIVYSSEDYAEFLATRLPTDFPYVASIGQFWANYREAVGLTRHRYPFNWGYHVMLWVIGVSYSAELTVKGLYENTAGRLSDWTAGGRLSDEDRYAHTVSADYGRFIHVRPWYEYDFSAKLAGLWRDTPLWGAHPIRKWERKLVLSAEYAVKAAYAGVITLATRTAYEPQDDRIQLVVTGWSHAVARRHARIAVLEPIDAAHTLVATGRYDVFRDVVLGLAREDATIRITEIAGNTEILLTGVAPAGWTFTGPGGSVAYAVPLPTDPSRVRVALRVTVGRLLSVLGAVTDEGRLAVDHVYDY